MNRISTNLSEAIGKRIRKGVKAGHVCHRNKSTATPIKTVSGQYWRGKNHISRVFTKTARAFKLHNAFSFFFDEIQASLTSVCIRDDLSLPARKQCQVNITFIIALFLFRCHELARTYRLHINWTASTAAILFKFSPKNTRREGKARLFKLGQAF